MRKIESLLKEQRSYQALVQIAIGLPQRWEHQQKPLKIPSQKVFSNHLRFTCRKVFDWPIGHSHNLLRCVRELSLLSRVVVATGAGEGPLYAQE